MEAGVGPNGLTPALPFGQVGGGVDGQVPENRKPGRVAPSQASATGLYGS